MGQLYILIMVFEKISNTNNDNNNNNNNTSSSSNNSALGYRLLDMKLEHLGEVKSYSPSSHYYYYYYYYFFIIIIIIIHMLFANY